MVAYDWTRVEGNQLDYYWSNNKDRATEIAVEEIAAATNADLTVVLMPAPASGLGCWIEMGAALAAGKQVVLSGPTRESIFWYHPLVRIVSDLDLYGYLERALKESA